MLSSKVRVTGSAGPYFVVYKLIIMKPTSFNSDLNTELNVWCDKGDWYISFRVAGSYDKQDNSKRIAITRWLLKEWKAVKTKYAGKTLYCEPWGDDGFAEYRSNIYSKLGFEYEDKLTMVIEL